MLRAVLLRCALRLPPLLLQRMGAAAWTCCRPNKALPRMLCCVTCRCCGCVR